MLLEIVCSKYLIIMRLWWKKHVLGSSLDDQNTGKELSAKTTPKKPSPKTTTNIESITGKDYDPSVPSNHKSKDQKCLDSVR